MPLKMRKPAARSLSDEASLMIWSLRGSIRRCRYPLRPVLEMLLGSMLHKCSSTADICSKSTCTSFRVCDSHSDIPQRTSYSGNSVQVNIYKNWGGFCQPVSLDLICRWVDTRSCCSRRRHAEARCPIRERSRTMEVSLHTSPKRYRHCLYCSKPSHPFLETACNA